MDIDTWIEWARDHPGLLRWLGISSLALFVASLVLVPWFVARIPANLFSSRERALLPWRGRHPVLGVILAVLRNVLGLVLVLAGIAMLVLPGQGLLSIFVGLLLIDFPGKRVVLLGVVRRPAILRSMNWIRRRAGKPPLIVYQPPEEDRSGPGG